MGNDRKKPSRFVTVAVILAIGLAFFFGASKKDRAADPAPTLPAPSIERPRSAPADAVPAKVRDVLATVRQTGRPPSGYRGGTVYSNDGRGGGETLPRRAADGQAIAYREWDVNPYQRGVNRGVERLVTGSSGLAYYTADHYRTFVLVQ